MLPDAVLGDFLFCWTTFRTHCNHDLFIVLIPKQLSLHFSFFPKFGWILTHFQRADDRDSLDGRRGRHTRRPAVDSEQKHENIFFYFLTKLHQDITLNLKIDGKHGFPSTWRLNKLFLTSTYSPYPIFHRSAEGGLAHSKTDGHGG